MLKIIGLTIVGALFCNSAMAAELSCGTVEIETVLTGPRHGAMMKVSDLSCGNSGWICLDPMLNI